MLEATERVLALWLRKRGKRERRNPSAGGAAPEDFTSGFASSVGGVEQAFMPAVMRAETPASAAEVRPRRCRRSRRSPGSGRVEKRYRGSTRMVRGFSFRMELCVS